MNATVALGLLLTGVGYGDPSPSGCQCYSYPTVQGHVASGAFATYPNALSVSPYHAVNHGGPVRAYASAAWRSGYPASAHDHRRTSYHASYAPEVPARSVKPIVAPLPEPTPKSEPEGEVTAASHVVEPKLESIPTPTVRAASHSMESEPVKLVPVTTPTSEPMPETEPFTLPEPPPLPQRFQPAPVIEEAETVWEVGGEAGSMIIEVRGQDPESSVDEGPGLERVVETTTHSTVWLDRPW